MKNGDRLRNMTDEELSDLFCGAMEKIGADEDLDCCLICPLTSLCRKGRNGFVEWLNKESEDN